MCVMYIGNQNEVCDINCLKCYLQFCECVCVTCVMHFANINNGVSSVMNMLLVIYMRCTWLFSMWTGKILPCNHLLYREKCDGLEKTFYYSNKLSSKVF